MKTNCELPIGLLGWNMELNDYDFVLYHLLKFDRYKEYYKSIRKYRRLMLLDNSGFEMAMKGEELDWNDFINTIDEMNPDAYFIPDVLGDFDKTQDMVFEWVNLYQGDIMAYGIPVAQGKTESEIIRALKNYYMLGFKIVALPFHIDCFQLDDTVKSRARGRAEFCNRHQKILNKFNHVHLLGSHDWREPSMHQCRAIKTIDTSYPVKCAIVGSDMDGPKPNILIDDFIDHEFDQQTVDRIINSVKRFKYAANG